MPATATLDTAIRNLRINWNNSSDYGEYRDWRGHDTVSYTFPSVVNDGIFASEGDGLVHMSSTQKTFARLAFELWDDLVALNIGENVGADNADILFSYSRETDHGGSYTQTDEEWSGTHLTEARIWMSTGWDSLRTENLSFGSEGFKTYLHEIGHSLGLTHPGHYNADDDEAPSYDDPHDALMAQDTQKYTVMSYFMANADGSATDHFGNDDIWQFASTPQLYDIAAIQRIYGADMTTRTGDTVYGFHSNAGKVIDGIAFNPYDFGQNPNAIFAIWDAGGNDTIDASGYSTDQKINLAEGSFSSIGYLTDNIAIAFGARIENAIGGSGNDEIRGNDSDNQLLGYGGNDYLVAGGGVDQLFGGTGNDYLGGALNDILKGGAGDDTYYVTAGDQVTEYADEGHDTVNTELATYSLRANVEDLTFINIASPTTSHSGYGNALGNDMKGAGGADTLYGNGGIDHIHGDGGDDTLYGGTDGDHLYGDAGNDTLRGETGTDTLNGGEGNDRLYGGADADTLLGGADNDYLYGGAGRDGLTGGLGNDRFVYTSYDDSPVGSDVRDVIMDFASGFDRIDLSSYDARPDVIGNQAFRFAGMSTSVKHAAGELWFTPGTDGWGSDLVIVEGDYTGDGRADFQIEVRFVTALSAPDFVL
jgi:serralysin